MHIAEGMLPTQWWVGYSGAAAVLVAKGLVDYKKKAEEWTMYKQLTGVMTAAVFIISLMPIPVPVAGSSSHPGGTPLAAILMGPTVVAPMSVVALLFQALFLAHGGLTTLGANTLTMALFGGLTGYLIFRGARKAGLSLAVAAGIAGFLGDIAIYIGTSSQLALAIHGEVSILKVFFATLMGFLPTQLPLAVLEGVFTGLALKYVAEHRPGILKSLGVIDRENRINENLAMKKGNKKWVGITLVIGFALAIVLGLVTGQDFSGADEKVNNLVNQFALKVGAGERSPYINTDQGDLLLFLFLVSGLIAGFILGYHWRRIFGKVEEKP